MCKLQNLVEKSISACSSFHLKFSHHILALWSEAHLVSYSSLWGSFSCSIILYSDLNYLLYNLINISGINANKSHVLLLNNEETVPFPHYLVVNSCNIDGFEWMYKILMIYELMDCKLNYIMCLIFMNWSFVSIWSNFIAIGENYTWFPQGSKTSFFYLIERSDNNHGRLIGYEYESMIMLYKNPLIQFKNYIGFMHIWESISTTYPRGDLRPKLPVKSPILFRIYYRLVEVIGGL